MLEIQISNKFKKDSDKLKKQGKDLQKLRLIISILANEESIPNSYKDHSLKGNWQGFRELHIEPDWLLIYRIKNNELQLSRTGSHSELFR